MKTYTQKILLLLLIIICRMPASFAQCSFTPTVLPGPSVLCPDDSILLTTQQYDSYQWYKDGVLIPGATDSVYMVYTFNGTPSEYAVSATLDTCTELSAAVMIDSWVFLPVSVASSGNYTFDPNSGDFIICDATEPDGADTIFFELMMPYNTNITWYNNGVPIPNQNDDTLIVTQSGIYTVSASPQVCPNYIANLGVTLPVTLVTPQHPVILLQSGQLVATPSNLTNYQWYHNGVIIPGATSPQFTPTLAGSYTVTADDNFCHAISQQGFVWPPTSLDDVNGEASVLIRKVDHIAEIKCSRLISKLELFDLSGKLLFSDSPDSYESVINMFGYNAGVYLIKISSGNTSSVHRVTAG